MKAEILVKNAIRCKKCGDIIESKYTHNFVTCSCGACSVDGGLDYLRRCGDPEDYEDLSEAKEVEVTPKYKVGDVVEFDYFIHVIKGTIQMVDTFRNSTTVYYDILYEKESRLYEHINESEVKNKLK